MSNTTSTSSPPTSNPSGPGANDTSPPATPPPTSTPTSTPTTSTPPPPPTSTPPTTTAPPPPSSTPTTPPTSSPVQTTIVTTAVVTPTNGIPSTLVTTVTSTQDQQQPPNTSTTGTGTTSAGAVAPTGGSSGGLNNQGRIAVAVVVPIAAVALLVLAGIFLWRKRKQRKDAEEQRRKEVEDYTYNPNADPAIPAAAGGYEMKEDGSSGYRGWGSTTLAGSTGRKASTTMSGGAAAYSDATSPTRGGISDTRSGDHMANDGTHSPEGEILGVMGPPAAENRGANIHRGPSNASSSYSAAARSDGSGEGGAGVAYGDPNYYNQYGTNNPYEENTFGSPTRPSELGGAPVIRDNPARRNARIENPAHYPQQSAGISQNF